MRNRSKKLVTAILTAALALSCTGVALADSGSPTAPEQPAPGVQEVDTKKQDTTEVVVSRDGTRITATEVEDKQKATVGGTVTLVNTDGTTSTYVVNEVGSNALDGNENTTILNTTKTITSINKNALAGSNVSRVNSNVAKNSSLTLKKRAFTGSELRTYTAKGNGEVIVKQDAFRGTQVKNVSLRTKSVTLEKGAFYHIKKKSGTKIFMTNISKSKNVKVEDGVFGKNSKDMTIRVSEKKMTEREFKKFKRKMIKAGFKGKFVRQ